MVVNYLDEYSESLNNLFMIRLLHPIWRKLELKENGGVNVVVVLYDITDYVHLLVVSDLLDALFVGVKQVKSPYSQRLLVLGAFVLYFAHQLAQGERHQYHQLPLQVELLRGHQPVEGHPVNLHWLGAVRHHGDGRDQVQYLNAHLLRLLLTLLQQMEKQCN